MAVELATGYISLVPSARGLSRGLARELNGPLTDAGRRAGDDASAAFGGRFTAGLKSAAKTAGIALGVAFGAAGTYGVKVAADFQQTRIAFEGILGSAEEADKRLTELQRFAAKTPFEFAGLAESAQQLLAVGFVADDIIPTMTTLGNVAANLGAGENEIKGVVRALGQMKGKGKASAQELLQISEQLPGFSAIDAIAKDMGISVAAAFKLMEQGAIPADRAIEAILNGMESFPGAAGAMERQSKTLNGVLSTFKDTLNIALIEGIEPFLPAVAGALLGAIPTIETFVTGTVNGVATVVRGLADFAGFIGGTVVPAVRDGFAQLADNSIVAAFGPVVDALGPNGLLGAAIATATGLWAGYRNDGINPVIAAYEGLLEAIEPVTSALAEQKDILIPAAAAAASFAAAFVTYTQVSRGITAITSAASLLGPALGAALAPLLASPVGLAIAAVAAIAGAFAAAYLNIEPFRNAVDGVIDVVGGFASDLLDDALPALQDFAETVVDIARTIASGFTKGIKNLGGIIDRNLIKPLAPLGRFLRDDVAPAFQAFGEFVAVAFERFQQVIGPAVAFIRENLQLVAGILSDALGPAIDIFISGVTGMYSIASSVFGAIADVLAPALGLAFDALAGVVDIAFGVIVGILDAFFGTVEGIFTALTGLLQGDFGKVWEGITQIIGAPIGAVRDIVVNTFEEIIGFIGGVPGRIGDFIGAIFGGAVDIATTIFESIRDTVVTTLTGMIQFVGGIPERIGNAASGMWDAIAEAFEDVVNFIIRAWNSLDFTISSGGLKVAGKQLVPAIDFTIGVPDLSPVDFASGGIVTARPGGLVGRLGEAGRDEAVVPLPPGFDIADLAGGGSLVGGDLNVLQMPGEDSVETAMRELNRIKLLLPA